MNAMNEENRTFKGCLYFGLMLTKDGAKVIEYNCRFGDPETQVVLPLLKTDLFTIFKAVSEEKLYDVTIEFSEASACCVILASGGYPVKYNTGYIVEFNDVDKCEDISIFHAGTRLDGDGNIVTSGGRVLGVSSVADSLNEAIKGAYEAVGKIYFKEMYFRRDIGAVASKNGLN